MSETTEQIKPTCPKCGKGTVYSRIDGSMRCTTCGYDSSAIRKKMSEAGGEGVNQR